ncbi:MAG TPA: 2-oxoglutarate dehydrogenase complex dihydrolipoyllysine-residue succinyltransferase [Thermoanaerobaculia bacterium]
MPIELKIPSVGESITEAVIGEWLKAEGDAVAEDEPVVVIETDKVNVEVPAPEAGVLSKILKQEGDSAKVGDVIGYIEAGAAEDKAEEEEPEKDKPKEKPKEKGKPKKEETEEEETEEEEAEDEDAGPRVTPAARRALADAGLEPADVEATGPGGRLLKEDVRRHLEKKEAAPKKEAEKKDEPAPSEAPAAGPRQEEAVRMTPLRKRVAQRLVQAQQTAALLTTFNEIDMTAVMAMRRRYKEPFQEAHGIKLGFMSFFVKAVIEALKAVPRVNAELRDDEIVYHNYYDVGVAVGGGKGLVVPVIRNAERLSFAEVEKTIADLAARARDSKLKLEELQGGTFTISNGGIYGSLLSTPIVNPPQSGILGLHKIEDRPIAKDGQVVVRPMMYVALTYDHRIVDGREAVGFLVRIKEAIEDPSRMLVEV